MNDNNKFIDDKVDICDILSHYGIDTSKEHTECTLHNSQNKQSLHIYKDTNTCHCFAPDCITGGAYNVVATAERLDKDTQQSLIFEKITEITGVKYNTQKTDPLITRKGDILTKFFLESKKNKAVIETYIKDKRGLTDELFNISNIGYMSKNDISDFIANEKLINPTVFDNIEITKLFSMCERIIHPHYNREGTTVLTLTGEMTPFTQKYKDEEKVKKYVKLNTALSPTNHTELYLLPNLQKEGTVFWTEGFWDALQLDLHNINTISFGTCGISNHVIDTNFKHLLKKKVVIVFDDEENESGKKGAISLANRLIKKGCENIYINFLDKSDSEKIDIDLLVQNKSDDEIKSLMQNVEDNAIPFEQYILSEFKSEKDLDQRIEGLREYYDVVNDVTKNRIENTIKSMKLQNISIWDIFCNKTPGSDTKNEQQEHNMLCELILDNSKNPKSKTDLQHKVFGLMKNMQHWNSKNMAERQISFQKAYISLIKEWEKESAEASNLHPKNTINKQIVTILELLKNRLTYELTYEKMCNYPQVKMSTKRDLLSSSMEKRLSGLSANSGIIPNEEWYNPDFRLKLLVDLKKNSNFSEWSQKNKKNRDNYVNLVNLELCNLLLVTDSNKISSVKNEAYLRSIFLHFFIKFSNYFGLELTELTQVTDLTKLTRLTNNKKYELFLFILFGFNSISQKDLLDLFSKLGFMYDKSTLSYKIKRTTATKAYGLLVDGIYEEHHHQSKTTYCTSNKGLLEGIEIMCEILNEDLFAIIKQIQYEVQEEKTEELQETVLQFIENNAHSIEIDTYKAKRIELKFVYDSLVQHELIKEQLYDNMPGLIGLIRQYIPKEFLKGCKRDDVTINIKNLPDSLKMRIGDIRDKHMDRPVKVHGRIITASPNQIETNQITYECGSCGNVFSIQQDSNDGKLKTPQTCGMCQSKKSFREIDKRFRTYQVLKIQERSEDMAGRSAPRDIRVYAYDNLTLEKFQYMYNLGNDIIIDGYVQHLVEPKNNVKNKDVKLYVQAMHVDTDEIQKDFTVTDEDEVAILELARRDDISDLIAHNLSHDIRGMLDEKKAVMCSLVNAGDNDSLTHTLLIGDPSVGKSRLCLDAIRFIPNGGQISGQTSTGVGLTASVERDEVTGQWTVRAGALPMSNNAVLICDELDKIADKNSLLEPMEHGEIHVNKASVNTRFKCNTAIVATANPKFGRFQQGRKMSEQIDLPLPLLSRFDLLFAIKNNSARQEIVTSAVLKNRMGIKTNDEYELIDEKLLRKYFSYARKLRPVLPEELYDFVLNTIKKEFSEYSNMDGRMIHSIINIAIAFAKIRLKTAVTDIEILESIELKKKSLDSYLTEKDMDEILLGVTDLDRTLIDSIGDFVRKHKEASHVELVTNFEEFTTKDNIERVIIEMKKKGELLEYKSGVYRLKR